MAITSEQLRQATLGIDVDGCRYAKKSPKGVEEGILVGAYYRQGGIDLGDYMRGIRREPEEFIAGVTQSLRPKPTLPP